MHILSGINTKLPPALYDNTRRHNMLATHYHYMVPPKQICMVIIQAISLFSLYHCFILVRFHHITVILWPLVGTGSGGTFMIGILSGERRMVIVKCE